MLAYLYNTNLIILFNSSFVSFFSLFYCVHVIGGGCGVILFFSSIYSYQQNRKLFHSLFSCIIRILELCIPISSFLNQINSMHTKIRNVENKHALKHKYTCNFRHMDILSADMPRNKSDVLCHNNYSFCVVLQSLPALLFCFHSYLVCVCSFHFSIWL